MIHIHHRDITDIDEGYRPDCIVNASNPELTCGGGVSGAIHAAVGHSDLEREAGGIHMIGTGSAVLQTGGNLTNWVIQTVAPRKDDKYRVDDAYSTWREPLAQCYWNCLQLAVSASKPNGPVESMPLDSIAFPMLGTGAYGLPWKEADEIAFDTCQKFGRWCGEWQSPIIHLVIGPHSEDGEERYELLARKAKELRGVSVTT
tara:strand:+ start:1028 stop:1633 length:606 start_codon:yes stop_codon:yes gene_type:complete